MKWADVTFMGILAACAPPKETPLEIPSVPESSAPEKPAPTKATPVQAKFWRAGFPTLETAGAAVCRILPPVGLGPRGEGDTILGFGPRGGVATFKRDPVTLVIQPVGREGSTKDTPTTVAVSAGMKPRYVFWLNDGYLVLLRNWDWQKSHVAWSALLFEPSGHASDPVDVGLDGMDVRVGQVLDRQRVGLVVANAGFRKPPLPGRWQTLALSQDAVITSSPRAMATNDLVTTTNDAWEPAELDGKYGWVVLTSGKRKLEGVFDGVRKVAGQATLLRPSDGLVAEMQNAAVPPPRGPGGMIREARGRPTLVRTLDGKPIGQRLLTVWLGNPVGSVAMNIESLLFWTGTHFLYPFRDPNGANLLPIDCRP